MHSYGKFIYLSFDNFYNVAKKEIKSFQKYCMNRDLMIFSNSNNLATNAKCDLCRSKGHEFDQCSSVFYLPSPHRQLSLGGSSESLNERVALIRGEKKRFNSLRNRNMINITVLGFGIYNNLIIDSDIN